MITINVKAATEKTKIGEHSILIDFVLDGKETAEKLDARLEQFNLKLSPLQRKNIQGKQTSVEVPNPSGAPDLLVFLKVKAETVTMDTFRALLAGRISSLKNNLLKELHVFIPEMSEFVTDEKLSELFSAEGYYFQTFVEGIFLGAYGYDAYKSEKSEACFTVFVHGENSALIARIVKRAEKVIDGVRFARALENEPSNNLCPQQYVERVSFVLKKEKIAVTVFDEKELAKRKMNGILAVGSGSTAPPRLMIATYKPKGKAKGKIALVGKGITFDSGGISIKHAEGMGLMKADMSGAAVVAGTLLSAAKLALPYEIIGVMALAENMPSGSAMRPGDILTVSNGKSIEIVDTDAEGRLVLSDALHYASQCKPDTIIDLATLTGACVVALGDFVGGLFSTNDALSEALLAAGKKTHDRVWSFPMWDDYNNLIKSKVADLKNLGPRWGGGITAAKFLEHFVDKSIPWAHLDIAGPSMPNDSTPYTKDFMTGFGVRLLIEYVENH